MPTTQIVQEIHSILKDSNRPISFLTDDLVDSHEIEFAEKDYLITSMTVSVNHNANDYARLGQNINKDLIFTGNVMDENGEDAKVFWKAHDNWKDIQHVEDLCDWDTPLRIEE